MKSMFKVVLFAATVSLTGCAASVDGERRAVSFRGGRALCAIKPAALRGALRAIPRTRCCSFRGRNRVAFRWRDG